MVADSIRLLQFFSICTISTPMGNSNEALQVAFFKRIKAGLPKHLSLVNEVADHLDLSHDSAYRRIRGETALTMIEITGLCRKFGLSFDEFSVFNEHQVNFDFRPLNEESFNFLDYLLHIEHHLKKIAAADDKEVVYTANEIPLFHLMHAPLLASFKLFFWQKTILDFSAFRNQKFKPGLIDNRVNEVSRSIRDLYCEIPSTEIYHSETIDTTLKQVDYYADVGYFESKDDALMLLDSVAEVVDHIRWQCEMGFKFKRPHSKTASINPPSNDGSFTVFHNEVLHMDNSILVKIDNRYLSFLTSNGLNSLSTESQLFYEEYHRALEILKRKCTIISGTSERERNKVFLHYQEKIDRMRRRLSSSL